MPKFKKIEKPSETTVDSLIKEYSDFLVIGSDPSLQFGRISFGIPALDNLTGGGIPKKRITILMGSTNVGKSYLASQIARNVQKNNGLVAWLDTEISWDSNWMEKCGLDTSKVLLSQPITGEDSFDLIRNLMKEGVDLIVLDSMAGLVPSAIQDEDFSYNPMAWQARFINQSLPRIMPFLKYGSALVLINQTRASMGPVSMPNMPGGQGQTFFSHFIIELRRSGWIEDSINVEGKKVIKKVGFDIDIIIRKSKIGGQSYDKCTVPFKLEGGIDLMETFVREAIAKGLIHQAGPWFNIFDTQKCLGMNGVREYFTTNPDQFEVLKQRVIQ
ncbi:MAG: AAA family ATPase [Nanoarchaeota archaeon]